jgi:hypothetical protein
MVQDVGVAPQPLRVGHLVAVGDRPGAPTGEPRMPPEEQSITSTPFGFTILASATPLLRPPARIVLDERRRNSGLFAGQCARTHSTTSIAKRMRFDSLPPYSSLRTLANGERN